MTKHLIGGRSENPIVFVTGLPLIPQREIESRAAILGRLRPDPTAMTRHDPLDRGETDAGALEFLFGVHALEWLEKLLCMGHVESGAVVAHEEHRLVRAPFDPHFYPRLGLL